MNRFLKTALPAALCAAMVLSGCGAQTAAAPADASSPAASSAASSAAPDSSSPAADSAAAVNLTDITSLFSERDLSSEYETGDAITVRLTGSTAECTSDTVSISGGRITLLDEGVYFFSGTLTDGQIVVNAGRDDKVQIVLSGADITSASSAAIYCLKADKVFVTLSEGTDNALANGGTFVAIDDNNIDAAVFSKTDLTMNGSGSVTVTIPAGHGIVSKDELTITGGTYTVTAAKHGLVGKDSVAVAGGSFTITSGKDGIHAENNDDDALGFLYIADGSFTINAQGDAISAASTLQIDGGSYALTTAGGSASVTMQAGDTMQRSGFKGFSAAPMPSAAAADTAEDTESCKGIKADGALTVNGGTFVLDTADDAVHCGADITITGGEWTIRTGDDGIHADAAVVIQAGTFSIPYCYEGVEGQSVTIDGGTLNITACDDGINAAGGADSSGADFGFGRQDQFAADGSCFIVINGGTITIVSDGDSIDSNGSLTVNGGTADLTCNGNGNTAIDTNGAFTNNGGTITTNDGSESGSGGMGGKGGDRILSGRGGAGGEKPSGTGKENGGMMRPTLQTQEPKTTA